MKSATNGASSDRAKQKNPTNELINHSPRKRGQRVWTAEQRAAAALRASRQRPWLHATGPRTQSGKDRSKMNAYRHGHRGKAHRRLIDAIHEQARFSNAVNQWVSACKRARRAGLIEPTFAFQRKPHAQNQVTSNTDAPPSVIPTNAPMRHAKDDPDCFPGCVLLSRPSVFLEQDKN